MQPPPQPTEPFASRTEVFVAYLAYFRGAVVSKLEELSEQERRASRLSSGWTPLELMNHLSFVEHRWLEWGFLGLEVPTPWGDREGDRWHVPEDETYDEVLTRFRAQSIRSDEVIESHDLEERGRPSPRWEGAEPPSLERILFHLLQEYARHVGHLDIVVEIATTA